MSTYTDMLAAYGVTVARPGGKEMTNFAFQSYPIKGEKVLEIGCGLGETANFIAESFDVEVTAIDHHPKMIQKAKDKHKEKNIQWLIGDIAAISPSNTYDNCIVESVLSFTNISNSLRNIYSLLSDGGKLYLLEPIYLGGLEKKELEQYMQFYRFNSVLTMEEWLTILEKNQLTIKKIMKSSDMLQNSTIEEIYPELVLDK